MIIHQLICGETIAKGWGVLKTTLPNLSLAESVAFVSNLQDSPGGVTWAPVIRAFSHKDFFLLMKTFPDKSSDVRKGRAFSHVLLIGKEDVVKISDLGLLFKYFSDQIDKSINIGLINFNPNDANTAWPVNISQARFNKVIYGYVRPDIYKKTIIWIGEDHFEQAIGKFWQILSNSDKEKLNIGINFNVSEIPNGMLNFITTPENIENKFLNHGFCVVRKNDKQTLTELSEQILAGDIIAGQRIKRFQDAIEATHLSRSDINNIAIVIKTFEEIDFITDLKKLNSLSHIVAEYSPNKIKGIAFKEKLVDKICKLIEECDVTELSLIKNFKVGSFQNSENKFSLSVKSWLVKYLFSEKDNKKKNFEPLFKQLNESTASSWWTKLIIDNVHTFLTKISLDKATIVFNWLQSNFTIFQYIETNIDSSKESEFCFISRLPSTFDKINFTELKEFAIKRGWFNFHATILILEHPFEQALSEQLLVDTNQGSSEGVEIIIKSVKPKSLIEFTIANGDKRLIEISGKFCHKDPSLMDRINFTNVYWQKVWMSAISNGNTVFDGFIEPQKKVFSLYDAMVNGIHIDETLLEKICETEYSNLLPYKRRENLWNIIPSNLRPKFLGKTASVLLELLSKDSTVVIPNDKVLSNYIIQYAISDFLYYNRNNIKSTMPIFNKFNQIPESILKVYINNYNGKIDVIDAAQLGILIYERNFDSVASVIYGKATKHNNWKFALAECYRLLDFFTKAAIAYSDILKTVNITTDQWWESAEEIIIDFYPNGVSLAAIWKKAGGKEAELLINTTAENVWRDALSKLRNKGFKNVTMNSLLKEINKTYSENEKFKLIYQLRKNYISVNSITK